MLAWLATAFTPGNMERWFARAVLVEAEEHVVIAVADGTLRDWLSQRLSARVHEVLRERGEERPARFVLVEERLPARAG